MAENREQSLIISYLAMRRLIGSLGILLPIIVIVGNIIEGTRVLEGSISGYYYTNMRDCFVGILSGVAFFLLSYRGYARVDDLVARLSGLSALGIILFPTGMYAGYPVRVGVFLLPDNISEAVHLTFGGLFFLALSFIALFLFTRHSPGSLIGKDKRRRNVIYRSCGVVMVMAIVSAACYTIFLRETVIAAFNPVLILESIALFAFGVSWVVKGNTFFRDSRI